MNYRRPLIKSLNITLMVLAIAGLLCATSIAAQDFSSDNIRKMRPSHRLYRHISPEQPQVAITNPEGFPVYLAQNDSELSNARERWKNLSP